MEERTMKDSDKSKYERVVTEYLIKLGIPDEMLGFRDLKESILEFLLNDSINIKNQKHYDTVAQKFNIAAITLYNAMRKAIFIACHTNNDFFKELFGSIVDAETGNITCTKFITIFVEYLKEKVIGQEDLFENQVTKYLRYIGIPASRKGYFYLKAEILYCLRNNGYVPKGVILHEIIGRQFNMNPETVSNVIMMTIDRTFCSASNYEILKTVFGKLIDPEKGKPKVRDFIARSVEYINLNS